MRYRLPVLALLVLPLAQCSCQRHPDAEPASANTARAPSADDATTGPATVAPPSASATATRAAEQAAVSTLHAYLGALPADRARADAYWAGGSPGARPDDAALRAIPDLRAMRIENERPQALDRQSPPGAFEIPVRLRLDTDRGPGRMHGTYRLRARVDGQGWELTSASLQTTLD